MFLLVPAHPGMVVPTKKKMVAGQDSPMFLLHRLDADLTMTFEW